MADRPERDAQATAGPSNAEIAKASDTTKRKNRGNIRKRPAQDEAQDEAEEATG